MRISGYLGWNLGIWIKQYFHEICKINGICETGVLFKICVDGERKSKMCKFNDLRCFGRDLNQVYTGLFKMIVGVLTTCHTQYT